MKHWFTSHPASVGESYWQHLRKASGFGTTLLLTGLACLFHGLLPFLFKDTGSRNITLLHEKMVTHRCKKIDQGVDRREQRPSADVQLPSSL